MLYAAVFAGHKTGANLLVRYLLTGQTTRNIKGVSIEDVIRMESSKVHTTESQSQASSGYARVKETKALMETSVSLNVSRGQHWFWIVFSTTRVKASAEKNASDGEKTVNASHVKN